METTSIKKDEENYPFAHIPIVSMTEEKYDEVLQDLTNLINRHSLENESNTPDFILAEYLLNCYFAFNAGVNYRKSWYGPNTEEEVLGECAMPNQPIPGE